MPSDRTVLRIYEPAECDSSGVPLDWERCRNCAGLLPVGCLVCAGRGSLKAAALAGAWMGAFRRGHVDENHVAIEWERMQSAHRVATIRCEDCGHPMGGGTWDGPRIEGRGCWLGTTRAAMGYLATGKEPPFDSAHYSPCDEGCRHGGPARMVGGEPVDDEGILRELIYEEGVRVEASWRPVDVRTLGWPHDLRPERLAVLCLRCWVTRNAGAA